MKVGFIGVGKMAEAIIASLVSSRGGYSIFASEIDPDRGRLMKRRYGINVYKRNLSVIENTKMIFMAVKPQDLDSILEEMAPELSSEHLLISIAAGKTLSGMEALSGKARVVRVMPNLATQVSEGMSVFCKGRKVTAKEKKAVAALLACFGRVLELPEEQFDAVTALSGSGPAFFAHFLELMTNAAEKQGLERKDALLLAEQTMLGTARHLMEKQVDPVELIKSVKSPKGTTEAGLDVLQCRELASIVNKTIKAAAKRSKELSK